MQKTRRPSVKRSLRKYWDLYLLLIPVVAYFVLFKFLPMYGLQIAFKRYNARLGILGSPWVGMQYFKQFFDSYYFRDLLVNTLVLNVFQMAVGFPVPILLALIINEIRIRPLQKAVQNITYIPYFLSIVVIVSMLKLFSNTEYGLFNKIVTFFGGQPVDYFAKVGAFRPLYVFSGVWQNMGFNSVIYIAALSAIDPQLYEAASIDGASRIRKIIHVSIPQIAPTIVILFIMRIGSLMNVGFEKV